MATTTNYGWSTPDDTSLVKDGAAAIRTLGSSIDTSFVDLKGGTTGQVLAKASNTDLDFTWSAADPLSILDAKGDLISATAADTPARLAVGTNNQVLTADSTTATGLKWATPASGAYTLITSGNLSSTEVSITSIAGTYKSLRLVVLNPTASANNTVNFRLNGNTGTNYTWRRGAYTTALFTVVSAQTTIDSDVIAETTATFGRIVLDLPGYANAEWHGFRTYGQMGTTTINTVNDILGGYIANTTAITSIQIRLNGTRTFTGGTYELYGEI